MKHQITFTLMGKKAIQALRIAAATAANSSESRYQLQYTLLDGKQYAELIGTPMVAANGHIMSVSKVKVGASDDYDQTQQVLFRIDGTIPKSARRAEFHTDDGTTGEVVFRTDEAGNGRVLATRVVHFIPPQSYVDYQRVIDGTDQFVGDRSRVNFNPNYLGKLTEAAWVDTGDPTSEDLGVSLTFQREDMTVMNAELMKFPDALVLLMPIRPKS